jgi:hypothetical protein
VSELEQLKKRIDDSGIEGIKTAVVRDDYEPAGDMMMRDLCANDNYVQRKTPMHSYEQEWRIFNNDSKPY